MQYDYNHINTEDTNDLSNLWMPLAETIAGIRRSAYGIDVREYLARGFESVASQMTLLNANVARTSSKIETVEHQLTEIASGKTNDDEIKKARVNIEGHVYEDLGTRLNEMELENVTSDITVGTADIKETALWIENIDDPDAEIEFVDMGYREMDSGIPVGIDTIQSKDIILENVTED